MSDDVTIDRETASRIAAALRDLAGILGHGMGVEPLVRKWADLLDPPPSLRDEVAERITSRAGYGPAEVSEPWVRVCLKQCWSCMCGSHFDEPTWHPWADEEDIAHAKSTGQPDPSGSRCGCWCAGDDR